MKAYEHYTVDDFLTDDWFLAWVCHHQPDACLFWQKWQEEHADQRNTILMAKDIAEALKNRSHHLSAEQERMEVARIVGLTRQSSVETSRKTDDKLPVNRGWVVAVVLVLLLGITGWFIQRQQFSALLVGTDTVGYSFGESARNQWINQVNGTSQPIVLSLPDGSQMTLMAHSRAWYPRSFAVDKRELYLRGEALFAVVHDSKRPFSVYSGTLVTRVLGTRFRVHARPGETQLRVSVLSGKVSVMDQTDGRSSQPSPYMNKAGVVLTVNQQVTYNLKQKTYQKELVDQPVVVTPTLTRPETFRYDDTPVTDVFEQLKKAYGIEIIYDATALRTCTLTASLAGVSLYDQLQLVCASVGATYEVIDTRIIIMGKGCS